MKFNLKLPLSIHLLLLPLSNGCFASQISVMSEFPMRRVNFCISPGQLQIESEMFCIAEIAAAPKLPTR